MNEDMIRKQSETAYKQWAVQWREHAKLHSKYAMKPMSDFENIGIGKAIVLAANGYSLEQEMETLKEHQGNVDILACDKSLGHLIRNGVKPTYLLVADANVDYEKYLKPYEDQLDETILFMNVCGNPKWSENGNWKDRYFFVCKDVIQSEKEFSALSGCPNILVAGTNVSNSMMVLLTQCDNEVGRRNFFGYDKLLLVGFDYCWNPEHKYYAYNVDGNGKSQYMRHHYVKNGAGEHVYTSQNLAFSAMWGAKYVDSFKIPVVQCSKQSIFMTPWRGVLKDQMRYGYKREDSDKVRSLTREMAELKGKMLGLQNQARTIALDHHKALLASV